MSDCAYCTHKDVCKLVEPVDNEDCEYYTYEKAVMSPIWLGQTLYEVYIKDFKREKGIILCNFAYRPVVCIAVDIRLRRYGDVRKHEYLANNLLLGSGIFTSEELAAKRVEEMNNNVTQ